MTHHQRRGRLTKWGWMRRASRRPHKAAALAGRTRQPSRVPPVGQRVTYYVWDEQHVGWGGGPLRAVPSTYYGSLDDFKLVAR